MGIEDHRLVLVSPEDVAHTCTFLRGLGFTETAPGYLQLTDDDHILECEVFGEERVTIALRFALCQPVTIDHLFSTIVTRIQNELGATISLPDSLGSSLRELQEERAEWQYMFGTETMRSTCLGAIERFIAPSWR